MKELTACIIILLAVLVVMTTMLVKMDRLLFKAQAESHEWEQRWRDCQAALSMLRTPHPADAVNDVTMP